MKKWKQFAAAALGIGLLAAGQAQSAENVTIEVLLTIQSVNIEVVGSTSIAVSAPAASSRISARGVIKNVVGSGSGNVDYSVKIASQTGSWTLYTNADAVPQDNYRLRAIWAIWTATMTTADFNDNDILTLSDQASSSTVFFSDSGTAANVGTPAVDGGTNVAPGSERSIFFRFDSGASGTTGSHSAYVQVSASATP